LFGAGADGIFAGGTPIKIGGRSFLLDGFALGGSAVMNSH
jgi:hypothetical protein